jgi:hypothetical protein
VVFACTYFGLYRSNDAGLTWVRVFSGENPYSSSTRHLAVDPRDPDHMFLGTANGMFESKDGGYVFQKSTAQGIGEGTMEWIQFHPKLPRYVFAATTSGVMRSADSGKTWSWIYFTTFPKARHVIVIKIDPFDPKRAYITTFDGMFTTADCLEGSLEDWKRLGGLRLISYQTLTFVACPKHKGHFWAITNMRLPSPVTPGFSDQGGAFIWESVDNGESWKVIFPGISFGSVQWIATDRDDPDLLWVAWSRSLVRMRRRQPKATPEAVLQRQRAAAQQALARYPTVGDLLLAVTRFGGVEPHRALGYRARSRLKALVPRFDASFTYYRLRDYPLLHDGLYVDALPYRFDQRINASFTEFRAMLNWDLSDLIFQLKASFFGRDARLNGELWGNLIHTFHRFHGELRRLNVLLAAVPPEDLRVRLMYKLRVQELESYIDFMSGGYLTRYKQGDRPAPWGTPWFDIWDDVPEKWFQGEYR